MTNGKKILWVVIVLIALFLLYQLVKRIRIGKPSTSSGTGTTTSSTTNTNTSTVTSTSTSTGIGTGTSDNSGQRRASGRGCTYPIQINGAMGCESNSGKTLQWITVNGVNQQMCCYT